MLFGEESGNFLKIVFGVSCVWTAEFLENVMLLGLTLLSGGDHIVVCILKFSVAGNVNGLKLLEVSRVQESLGIY